MSNVAPINEMQKITASLKHFQPILNSAKTRDINETDTVTIVKDMLNELFGYDKYAEVTSEFSIRGTFCDLAIKLRDKIQFLVEVKAIGTELKPNHIKQAVDYAANQGIDWVILTNGIHWFVFKVHFDKPIEKELVSEFNLIDMNHKNKEQLMQIYMLSKKGWLRSIIDDFQLHKKALDRYLIGSVILSKPTLELIRRGLKRISPNVKIRIAQIESVIMTEVFKRDVLEGESAEDAQKKVQRSLHNLLRKSKNSLEKRCESNDVDIATDNSQNKESNDPSYKKNM